MFIVPEAAGRERSPTVSPRYENYDCHGKTSPWVQKWYECYAGLFDTALLLTVSEVRVHDPHGIRPAGMALEQWLKASDMIHKLAAEKERASALNC